MTNHNQPVLTLADLEPGEFAVVTELRSQGSERRRMMDLGIVPGTIIRVEFSSPLRDPVAYQVRGAMVALRREQALLISIKQNSDEVTS